MFVEDKEEPQFEYAQIFFDMDYVKSKKSGGALAYSLRALAGDIEKELPDANLVGIRMDHSPNDEGKMITRIMFKFAKN